MEAVQHLKAQVVPSCSYVFATQTGRHLSYRNLLATMETACEAAGVEHRGLHALRHSFASNLYARGMEVKIISKLLGHAGVEITCNGTSTSSRATSTTPSDRRLGRKRGVEKADGLADGRAVH